MGAAVLPLVTQGLTSLGTSYQQSQAQKAQGAYQKSIAESNKKFAEIQADEAIKLGNLSANQQRAKTQEVIASQKAALAAQGIELDSGTAETLLKSTASLGELDAVNISNNAWREAWGYKAQAQNYSAEGRAIDLTTKNLARSTLITGGLQSLNYGVQAYSTAKKERDAQAVLAAKG